MASKAQEIVTSKPARATAAIALVMLGVLCIFAPARVGDLTFYTAINDRAEGLIDETLERDQVTFLVITAIKASLAVIEGSSVGVGFELQIGDVVQPAYDYVDFFWRAFLYAFMIMGFYKLLLETEMLLLGIGLMGLGLIMVGVSFGRQIPKFDLRLWGRRCLLIGILFAYIAPLSLLMTHWLSERYTSEIREEHLKTITAFDAQLDAAAVEFTALRAQISFTNPSGSLDQLKASSMRVVNRVGETFKLSLMAFLYYVLVIMFELLFFPLLSAVLLYKFAQVALGRLLLPPPAPIVVAPVAPATS